MNSPRYNVAPTQTVLCIRDSDQREFFHPKWGLIPSWAKDAKIGASCINARSETVDTKPAFRTAFKKRRCLVLADAFYEWRKPDKQPFCISLKSGPIGVCRIVGDMELPRWAGRELYDLHDGCQRVHVGTARPDARDSTT